jgi:hypothetical protein
VVEARLVRDGTVSVIPCLASNSLTLAALDSSADTSLMAFGTPALASA